jgi:hypothetical protein
MDIVVSQLGSNASVLHNTTSNSHHWLIISLQGTRSNRMGIGANLTVTRDDGIREYGYATTSVGYASSSDCRIHFGLGNWRQIRELTIERPSGIKQVLYNISSDQVLRVKETQTE